ncbi:septum formation initiator family protein [Corynebacterium sp. TAE3-ERU12]|uniref:FtsB family cell division protein n=1 Tax=Corynebacterium sp. TAE3-ERU12 TaxID=2849491 RepID=UPI001C458B94|nr:septum formation initiator family protein [Corynebacterium sp. TAE3-ERU12]MBV7295694.1 septum formation initiator family protein [Corynebacterium sp. TAE3-ERU12]
MTQRARSPRGSAREGLNGMSPLQIIGGGILVLVLAGTLIIPLRAYAEQRSQLAETRASIARLERRSSELENELSRYSDEAYIREQARVRLGLIEPGETPFRLIDPDMTGHASHNPGDAAAPEPDPWYKELWHSIAVPPPAKTEDDGAKAREESTSPDRVPRILPEPAPAE